MSGVIHRLSRMNEAVSLFVWGPPMLILFLGTGIFFTVVTRALQLRRLGTILRAPMQKGTGAGGIPAFSAVSGALAGTLGIGNIVGVAGAMIAGGPGAVFWMMASAFLCMILKYAETVLAVRYRTCSARGERVGGPMYVMRDRLGLRIFPVLFCIFCIAAALFGAGNITQVGTAAHAAEETFGLNGIWVSLGCALAVALMTDGSVGKLGRVFSVLVPGMSAAFLLAVSAVLFRCASRLPQAVSAIFSGAFSPRAAVGGVGGYTVLAALRSGVSRGVFSNEAGMGSSPIMHAASDNSPGRQGFCGAFEVFFDTVVMAGLTGAAILVSGVPLKGDPAALAAAAFRPAFGRFSAPALTVMLVVFAVSSVPCWYFYGEKCLEYLFPSSERMRRAYRVLFLLLTAAAPLIPTDGLWQLADSFNGLMSIPNLIAVLMLWPEVRGIAEAQEEY